MRAALLSLVLVAGCVSTETPQGSQGFSLDANGLQPAGTDLRVDFGRAQAGVIDTVTRLQGRGPDEVFTNSECGAGPVTAASWDDGVSLNFQEGSFQGWVLLEAGHRVTGTALEVGQTRADIGPVAFETTTLGEEFGTSGVFGIMDETGASVQLLWAGVTCFFR